MNILTKDAERVLAIAYKQYLERAKQLDKSTAKFIASDFYLQEKSINNWSSSDVYSCLKELEKAGYCNCYINGSFSLKSSAIIYMENRFKNGLNEVIDFITKFL